jgi:hypothetical protein
MVRVWGGQRPADARRRRPAKKIIFDTGFITSSRAHALLFLSAARVKARPSIVVIAGLDPAIHPLSGRLLK